MNDLIPIGYLTPEGAMVCEPCAQQGGSIGEYNKSLGFDWRGAWINQPAPEEVAEQEDGEQPFFVLFADALTYPQLQTYFDLCNEPGLEVDPIDLDARVGICDECDATYMTIGAGELGDE